MRKTCMPVHNGQLLEIFLEETQDSIEYWIVGPTKQGRMILGHQMTHDDLKAGLCYAIPGDLMWQTVKAADLPGQKHKCALSDERWGINLGKFKDSTSGYPQRLALEIFNALKWFKNDRKALEAAKNALLGTWTDGIISMRIKAERKLEFEFLTDDPHPLRSGYTSKFPPDSWNFAEWGILLLNNEHKCGERTGVLSVNAQEMHIFNDIYHDDFQLNRLAHILKRVGRPIPIDVEEPVATAKAAEPRRRSHPAAFVPPLLRRLGQMIAKRNPTLAGRLNPGMSEQNIQEILASANFDGELDPLIRLYSWRNGTNRKKGKAMDNAAFFPEDPYQFIDLESAVERWKSINQAAEQLQSMTADTAAASLFSEFSGQLFPIFDSFFDSCIAIDLSPGRGSRVVVVEFESETPVRQVYKSFDEFIRDAIRVNETETHLSCFDEK